MSLPESAPHGEVLPLLFVSFCFLIRMFSLLGMKLGKTETVGGGGKKMMLVEVQKGATSTANTTTTTTKTTAETTTHTTTNTTTTTATAT